MNAHTDITERLPVTDDEIEETIEGEYGELTGMMLVNYDETRRTVGDETFVSNVKSAEIYGFHLGGNVVLKRDHLVTLAGSSRVDDWEVRYAEERGEL